jgi:hypothetical protein
VSGEMFVRYIKGFDLVTNGTTTVTSSAGGFVTQRVNESHDSPYLATGDLFKIYGGVNDGEYLVTTVSNDTDIILDTALSIEQDQKFAVYRKIQNPIYTGSVALTITSLTVTLPSGNLSAGVAVGDYIFFFGPQVSLPYRIVSISGNIITLNAPIKEPSAPYDFKVYRDALLTNTVLQTSLPSFIATLVNGTPWVDLNTNDSELTPKKGDKLLVDTYPPFEIFDVDISLRRVYVSPTPTINDVQPAYINRDSKPLGFPLELNTTSDSLKLIISSNTSLVTTLAGSDVLIFNAGTNLYTWNILPGDFFHAVNGPDAAIDYGYGPGLIPIVEIPTALTAKITRPSSINQNNVTYELVRLV